MEPVRFMKIQARLPLEFSTAFVSMRLRFLAMGMAICFSSAACLPAAAQAKSHTFGNPEVWQWPPARTYHVENYRLKLRFEQAKDEVFGDEVVTLRPFLSAFRRFYLDSSGLQIDSVELQPVEGAPVALKFAVED